MTAGPTSQDKVVVIGGGPAGLTAAYELQRHGVAPLVVEKGGIVGGLSRTENYKGYHFDLGGHRFFTKSREVMNLWREVMTDDLLLRPRLSRIYYKSKFFLYPPKPANVLSRLGIWESARVVLSYVRFQFFPYRQEDTYEQWVTNRFGKRLFQIFFEKYTEKVWGISCKELKAEWAAQRIKDLSLKAAILSMIRKPGKTITSLIEEFHYPRRGPGMMWTTFKETIEQRGGTVRVGEDVVAVNRNGRRVESIVTQTGGAKHTVPVDYLINSMPVNEFVKRMNPAPPAEVLAAANALKHRDFLTVCLIIGEADLFPDNWIYIHDPGVKVGRIQNFKNWSPDMVPDKSKSSLGLEYFCNKGDALWSMSDAELIELGSRELARIGLGKYEQIEDGCVVRVEHAYPVYDTGYVEQLALVRAFVESLDNVQTIGRNGLHRYNNQDHAMLTGLYAARNLMLGEANDLWNVNADQEYHEQSISDEDVEVVKEELQHIFRRLDPIAFGCANAVVAGLGLFLATLWLVFQGGEVVGPNLSLLANYMPGYRVSTGGAAVGLCYAAFYGFLGGWIIGALRNACVLLYMAMVYRRARREVIENFASYL